MAGPYASLMRMDRSPTAPSYVQSETADIETASDDYARRFSGPTGRWMLDVQERITLGLLAEQPKATVLDVGGGHGQLAFPLCRCGYDVTVLGSAESCRKRITGLVDAGQCRFVTGSVIHLPFAEQAFDVTMAFRLLTHCSAWRTLIAELCRVACSTVIVEYPTNEGVNALAPALFAAKKKLEGNTRSWRPFLHREIEDEFRGHGFVPVERVPQFFLPLVLHRVLHCRPVSAALEGWCRGMGLTRRWGSPVILRLKRVDGVPGTP